MSNPVAPPPTNDGAYPPPAGQGLGDAPAAPPQQGFGDAPAQTPAPAKKGMNPALKVVLRIVLALIVGIGIYAVKDHFFGDKAKEAAAGDCIAVPDNVKSSTKEESGVDAKVVDCASADAAYTVVARVNGETSTSSTSCEKYFKEDEEYSIYASDSSGGYLLCLKPKA